MVRIVVVEAEEEVGFILASYSADNSLDQHRTVCLDEQPDSTDCSFSLKTFTVSCSANLQFDARKEEHCLPDVKEEFLKSVVEEVQGEDPQLNCNFQQALIQCEAQLFASFVEQGRIVTLGDVDTAAGTLQADCNVVCHGVTHHSDIDSLFHFQQSSVALAIQDSLKTYTSRALQISQGYPLSVQIAIESYRKNLSLHQNFCRCDCTFIIDIFR